MPDEPTPAAMDKKPKPQFGCKIMNQDGSTGRIVTDWFKIANDDRSWCYVMYDHQAGYCHIVEYAVFILPEGHPHYDQKINVIVESPIATVESQAKRIEELEQQLESCEKAESQARAEAMFSSPAHAN